MPQKPLACGRGRLVFENIFFDLIVEFSEDRRDDARKLRFELHDHRHDDSQNKNILSRGLARVVENEFFQRILIHRF